MSVSISHVIVPSGIRRHRYRSSEVLRGRGVARPVGPVVRHLHVPNAHELPEELELLRVLRIGSRGVEAIQFRHPESQ